MSAIPILDIGPFLAGVPGAREELAEALRTASEEVGFYFFVNHGVSQDLVDQTFEETRRFHALPHEVKMRHPQDEHYVGYAAPGSIRVNSGAIEGYDNSENLADTQAAYHVNRDYAPDRPEVLAGKRFYVPQPWPEGLPGFRENVQSYFNTLEALGRSMLPVYATALGVAPATLDPVFDDAWVTMRMIHYPAVERHESNRMGIGAHTDGGFISMLPQTKVPGLEVQLPSGEWLTQPVVPGGLLVNSGQMLRRLSNDHWLATPHRVISPLGSEDRYSIPLFLTPAMEAMIGCFPRPGEEPRHEPIRFIDFLNWYLAQNYGGAPDSTVPDATDAAA